MDRGSHIRGLITGTCEWHTALTTCREIPTVSAGGCNSPQGDSYNPRLTAVHSRTMYDNCRDMSCSGMVHVAAEYDITSITRTISQLHLFLAVYKNKPSWPRSVKTSSLKSRMITPDSHKFAVKSPAVVRELLKWYSKLPFLYCTNNSSHYEDTSGCLPVESIRAIPRIPGVTTSTADNK